MPWKLVKFLITNWDEGVNKAVDKYYGSKYDKAKIASMA